MGQLPDSVGNDGDHYNDDDRNIAYEKRLSRQESINRENSNRIERLTNTVDKLANSISDGFDKLNTRVASRDKTNWGVLGGLASVLLAIVGLAGSPYIWRLEYMNGQIDKLNAYDREAMYRLGRVDTNLESQAEESKALKAEILALDGRVQREMRDLDTTQIEIVKALRERIDEKIGLLLAASEADRGRLREDINRNRVLIDGITNQGSPAVLERLRAAERAVFGDANGATKK